MRIEQIYSYRHAESILTVEYAQEKAELEQVFSTVNWIPKRKKKRKRKGKVVATLDINQKATNKAIENEFLVLGWEKQPTIVSNSQSQLKADYKKRELQVEVQFGNMARWYTDVFKFLLSYSADDIEVGILVVPMHHIAKRIDENVVNYERVQRELPYAKMAVTIPIWLLGLG